MMSQMNATMAMALAGKAQAAPVIIVPPAQSETRRQDLNSIQSIKPIFDVAHFEAAWQPMDFAAGGEPASYNMDHARAAMRAALNKRLNQRGREYTKDFLRGTALFHWDMGAEGVTLEQFLPTKGTIVTWADFTAAWITMQRAYEDFAGPTLAMALVRFQSDLVELNATLPFFPIATIVFLVEEALGKLKDVGRLDDGSCTLATLGSMLTVDMTTPKFQQLVLVQQYGEKSAGGGGAVGGTKRKEELTDTKGTKKVKAAPQPTIPPKPTLTGPEPCFK
jgi:hypothetical protein